MVKLSKPQSTFSSFPIPHAETHHRTPTALVRVHRQQVLSLSLSLFFFKFLNVFRLFYVYG